MLRRSSLIPLPFIIATVAQAQDRAGPVTLDPIVVSATRTPIDAAKAGSSVEVIRKRDLDRRPELTFAGSLDRVPGVAIAERSVAGSSSEVSVRGFSSQDLLVRVDGIELTDPSELRTQADLGQFLLRDASRIEVLKGPQSALYGGEAVGGVIDIATGADRGTGALRSGFAEAGSYGTFAGGLGYSYGAEDWDLAISAQALRTDGFSAADENDGNTEDDGYDNVTVSATGSVDLGETLTLGGALRYFDRTTEFDGRGPRDEADAQNPDASFFAASELLAGRAFARFDLAEGRIGNELSVQVLDSQLSFVDPELTRIDGGRVKLEYLGTMAAVGSLDLLFGADWTRERIETDEIDADSEISGGFAQAILRPDDLLTLTLAGRVDHHSEFGTYATWRATAARALGAGTVLRAAVGTGFRAPSNRELFTPPSPSFGPVGNPDLDPEETLGWEAGIDQSFVGGAVRASATVFETRTDERIDFAFGEGYVQVPGETVRRGVELGVTASVSAQIDLSADYTYLDAQDPDGVPLDFVPRHDFGLGIDFRPGKRTDLALSANYVSGTVDGDVTLGDHVLVDATVSYEVALGTELYLRGVNLLDKEYQRVDGYGTSDRAAFAGVRSRF